MRLFEIRSPKRFLKLLESSITNTVCNLFITTTILNLSYDGVTGMDVLLNETDSEAVGFELDLYWVQAGGGSPFDWVRKVAGRMQVIHLKDMAIVSRAPVFAEVGEGNMDYDGIIEACHENGVEWYVVEQDVCRRDPFESLEISLRNLLKMV